MTGTASRDDGPRGSRRTTPAAPHPADGGDGHLPVGDRAAVRRALAELLRPERGAFGLVLALNALATAAGLVGPWAVGGIVDAVGSGAGGGRIDRLTAVFVGAAVLQIALTRSARRLGGRFGERVSFAVRDRFVGRVLALRPAVVERVTAGDLAARGGGDVGTVSDTVRDAAPDVLIAGAQALFAVLAVFAADPLLGACGVTGLLGVLAATRWYLRRARGAYLALGAAGSDLAEELVATVRGARTVELLGLEERRLETGAAAMERSRYWRMRTLALRTVLYPVIDVSYVLPPAAVLLVGGWLHGRGLVGVGTVVSCVLYLRQLSGPLETLQIWLEQLQSCVASFARLEGPAERGGPAAAGRAVPAGDRIEVAGVSHSYGGGRDVLSGVDLEVRPGEHLAIVGPSGAGKSTLARLLAGIEPPREGAVTVGGVRVSDLPPELLRRHIVLVTQEQHVFRATLRDNLLIARPSAPDGELLAALEAVGAGWAVALPGGLGTALGPRGLRPDGAQAQQLALARVVLADPHTVILDEATAMLDPAAARAAERALSAVLAGRTVLAVAHRLHTAHDADRVAVMADGRLTELGPHAELVAAGGVYAALWNSWHGGAAVPEAAG